VLHNANVFFVPFVINILALIYRIFIVTQI